MRPNESNRNELQRLRESVAAGDTVDWKQEAKLAEIDDAAAEAFYTQEAFERVNRADDELERILKQ